MRIVALLVAIFIFIVPIAARAVPFGFGGHVTTPPIPCAPGFVFGFAGFLNNIPYIGPVIWIPGTPPHLVDGGLKPPIPTQCIVGSVAWGACTLGIITIPAPIITPIPGYGTSIPGCALKKLL